ncbi:MAG: hypothetical protein R3B54_13895 [Bdellovibrionota bacterium]
MPKSLVPAGVLELEDWCSLQLDGTDIFDFLHRLSTLGFKNQKPGVRLGALLSGRAQLISGGFFEGSATGVLYTVPRSLAEPTLEHLEKFHFSEAVTFSKDTASSIWIADSKTAESLQPLASSSWEVPDLPGIVWFRVTKRDDWMKLAAQKAPMRRAELHAYFLAQGSILLDLDQVRDLLILEANLETAVERDKGCYPGQEEIERIFTYGNANKKLLAVQLDKKPGTIPCTLRCEDKEAGTLLAYEDLGGSVGGLAMVHRNFWETGHLKGDPDLIATIL